VNPFWVMILTGTATTCLGAIFQIWVIRKVRAEKIPEDVSSLKISIDELMRRMKENEEQTQRNENRLVAARVIVERIRGRLKMNGSNYEEG
jgi:hypothetical protein